MHVSPLCMFVDALVTQSAGLLKLLACHSHVVASDKMSVHMSVQLHMHLVQISIAYAATMSSTSFGVHFLQSGYELATRYTYLTASRC